MDQRPQDVLPSILAGLLYILLLVSVREILAPPVVLPLTLLALWPLRERPGMKIAIGTAVGLVAGATLDREAERRAQLQAKLDAELGVEGGDIGARQPREPSTREEVNPAIADIALELGEGD